MLSDSDEAMTSTSDPNCHPRSSPHKHDCNSGQQNPYGSWKKVFIVLLLASSFVSKFVFLIGTNASHTDINLNADIQNKTETSTGKFLVISLQRSGSGFMTNLINDHSKITCGAEKLLHKNNNQLPLDDYVEQIKHSWDQLIEKSLPSKSPKFVGFKIMYSQGIMHHGKDLVMELDRMEVKVIHLVRRNKLLQYISGASNNKDKSVHRKNQTQKHIAHPTTEEDASRLQKISVDADPKRVLSSMRKNKSLDNKVSKLLSANLQTGRYMKINYEDLSLNTTAEMARVFDFLGSDIEEVSSKYIKIHKDKRTRDYFNEAKTEKLREVLERSEFAWVLDGW
ncbi:hypothetical protein ACHAWF_011133 [Thalassiosira exigua]